jgi:branched-chain amino acid transport system substrate-binding protein
MNAPVNGNASADYLRAKRIPVIGTEGGATWAYTHWNYFIQGFQAPYLGLAGVGALAQTNPGKKKLGVIGCVEVTGCQLFYDTAPDDARDHKLDLIYRAKVSLTAPDFTSECIQARNAGVEIMMLGVDSNTVQRFVRSCKNIGYSPPVSMPHAAATTVLEDPNLEGLTEAVPFLPFVRLDHPAIVALHQARDRFAPGAKIEVQFTGGWVAGKLLERVGQVVAEPVTNEAILGGLWSLRDDTVSGLTYPLTFVKEVPTQKRVCWYPTQVVKGNWVDRSKGTMTCLQK